MLSGYRNTGLSLAATFCSTSPTFREANNRAHVRRVPTSQDETMRPRTFIGPLCVIAVGPQTEEETDRMPGCW